MGNLKQWWRVWAPCWEAMEDRHLSVFVTEGFVNELKGPALVVGAGQGLIVEVLKDRGIEVVGVDLVREMAALAQSRRGLDFIVGDGGALPFHDESFATVILSTGVLDYMDDLELIQKVLDESHRVLRRRGNLYAAFYQVPKVVEDALRTIGVISGVHYYMDRLFEVRDVGSRRPFLFSRKIARWTGRPLLPTLLSFLKLGLTLPEELKTDAKLMDEAIHRAEVDEGISRAELRRAVPKEVPYRGEREVRELFEQAGFPCGRIDGHKDCLVARCQRLAKGRRRPRRYRRDTSHAADEMVIRTEAISKSYPGANRRAVDALTVSVPKGSIFGFLGPNGAGKTTTLSMFCSLMKPDSGTITFFDGRGGRDLKHLIGYVPQELAVYPRLTARENMAFFGGLYGIRGAKLQRRVDELLQMVGLHERKDQLLSTFSTGMQRRLNLAAGLIHEPELILLDEPTVGIDPQSRNCIFESVLELKREGVSILYTTHYMEEASRLCDQIVIMDEGKIILEGDPREAVREYGMVRIEFALERASARLEETLWELDFVADCKLDGRSLSVAIDKDQDAMAAAQILLKRVERLGDSLSLNAVVEPSLESLFLEITGRSLRDVSAEGPALERDLS